MQHLEKVDVCIGQHAGPKVSELGLAAFVVRKYPARGAFFRGTYQGSALPGVPYEKVELALVSD